MRKKIERNENQIRQTTATIEEQTQRLDALGRNCGRWVNKDIWRTATPDCRSPMKAENVTRTVKKSMRSNQK
jgi:hypothetical protein